MNESDPRQPFTVMCEGDIALVADVPVDWEVVEVPGLGVVTLRAPGGEGSPTVTFNTSLLPDGGAPISPETVLENGRTIALESAPLSGASNAQYRMVASFSTLGWIFTAEERGFSTGSGTLAVTASAPAAVWKDNFVLLRSVLDSVRIAS